MVHEPRHKFSPEKRIEVVTKFLALGNMRLVAELTGVSYQLIRLWKTQEWWIDLEAEIRASRAIEVDNKLSKIVDKSLETVADRLENGDLKWNRKTGEVERVPVSLALAHKVAQESLSQQAVQANKTTHESTAAQAASIADQIKMLASEFAKFNTNRTVRVQAEDITDAVYDQREARLQEAVREVRWSPESDQGEDGEEQGSLDYGTGGESTQGGWEGRGSPEAIEQGWIDDEEQPEGGSSFIQP